MGIVGYVGRGEESIRKGEMEGREIDIGTLSGSSSASISTSMELGMNWYTSPEI